MSQDEAQWIRSSSIFRDAEPRLSMNVELGFVKMFCITDAVLLHKLQQLILSRLFEEDCF